MSIQRRTFVSFVQKLHVNSWGSTTYSFLKSHQSDESFLLPWRRIQQMEERVETPFPLLAKWWMFHFLWARRRKEEFFLRKIGGEKKISIKWTSIMCQVLEHMIWLNHFISFKQVYKNWYLQMSILRIRAAKTTHPKAMTLAPKPIILPHPVILHPLQTEILLVVTYSLVVPGAKEHEVEQCKHHCFPSNLKQEIPSRQHPVFKQVHFKSSF